MTASPDAIEVATIAAHAAADLKAENVVAIDVSEPLVITDVFLIASADNERQVNAITEEIEDKLRDAGHKPLRREGTREGRWALLDYGDVVIHVQHGDERDFYGLERLWKDCPILPLDGDADGA
ncbi:MAG: ribosome silencing factor [Gordonia sp. (in: high G+C Gram-positive bacteria)]|uniref:ribosome silencing factor n=1 Tax=Gordonia sp. (in: high G+C Gram-positive bacteria) TaxID=84139 RepID=UPI0039E2C804